MTQRYNNLEHMYNLAMSICGKTFFYIEDNNVASISCIVPWNDIPNFNYSRYKPVDIIGKMQRIANKVWRHNNVNATFYYIDNGISIKIKSSFNSNNYFTIVISIFAVFTMANFRFYDDDAAILATDETFNRMLRSREIGAYTAMEKKNNNTEHIEREDENIDTTIDIVVSHQPLILIPINYATGWDEWIASDES